MELTQQLIKELFDYHEDGYLIWKTKMCNKVKIGNRAGSFGNRNRYVIKLYGKNYLCSRLIFFYHTGEWPEEIDHENNISTDDRIKNLRPASRVQNVRNKTSAKNSSSKYLGVYWRKNRNVYVAEIVVNGKKKYLMSSINESEPALAYNKAAVKYFGEFANLNIIRPSVLQNNS